MNDAEKLKGILTKLLDTKQTLSEKSSLLLSKEISKFDKYNSNKTNVDERDYSRILPSIKTMKSNINEYGENVRTNTPKSFEELFKLIVKEMTFLRSLYSNSKLLSSKANTETIRSELNRFCGVVSGVLDQHKVWMETLFRKMTEALGDNEKYKKTIDACKTVMEKFSKEDSENVTPSQWKRFGIIILKVMGLWAAIFGTLIVVHKGYEYKIQKTEEKYGTLI